jgi:hypothetical protein
MKIQTILEKIITGKQVKFSIATIGKGEDTGNKIIKVEDVIDKKSKKYYIYHSLINFVRFKDWDEKIAFADIQEIKKPVIVTTDGEKLYPIHINTEVEVPKKNYNSKDNTEDYYWYDEI